MISLFNLGFRPFFLGAGVFAAVSMAFWGASLGYGFTPALSGISATQWHAHEMIYGYALAVIAGFLLTAIRNWTGLPTLNGTSLAWLFGCWVSGRILWLFGSTFLPAAALMDLLFAVSLSVACALPIVRTRQWRQMAILTKLIILGAGNALFYVGALGALDDGIRWSLHGGVYLVIALIMTMGRRLIPFFTERGVTPPVKLRNSKILDISSLVLFVIFFIAEVFLQRRGIAAAACIGLFVVNTLRLAGWHTPGIWSRPLLWSLYLAFAIIDLGFLLFAAGVWWQAPGSLALHAFAVGGIGIMTLGMMMRVSLGHTGRNVHQPPAAINIPLALISVAVLARVVLPLLAPAYYQEALLLSSVLWIGAFAAFTLLYFPILTRPRADGAPG